ncbi:MAG: FtsL-like putative cell division protein [Bacteroidales bacterium]
MGKKNKNTSKSAAKGIQSFLGGSFLTRESTSRNFPFLLFLAGLAIIYIGNSYYAEKNIRQVESLQKQLKEIRYEYISIKSDLMQNNRQSKVAGNLANKGIKESTVPPKKIFTESD